MATIKVMILALHLIAVVERYNANAASVRPGSQTVCFTFLFHGYCNGCTFDSYDLCCPCETMRPGLEKGILSCDWEKHKINVGCSLVGRKEGFVFELADKTLDINGGSIYVQRGNKIFSHLIVSDGRSPQSPRPVASPASQYEKLLRAYAVYHRRLAPFSRFNERNEYY